MCLSVGMMMGLTALQGVSQIAATYQQAKAQQAYYDAQAQAAEQNADIQAKKGEQIAEQYAYEQQKLNDRRRLVAGQQAAAFGAAGISGDMGTALDLSDSSFRAYRKDSNQLLSNQRNDQWSNYLGVVNYKNQANAARASAYNVKQQAKQQNIGTTWVLLLVFLAHIKITAAAGKQVVHPTEVLFISRLIKIITQVHIQA